MEELPSQLEHFLKHLAHLPRKLGNRLQATDLCYIFAKKNWITCTYDSYGFSFILEGRGTYSVNGAARRVIAPCVLTQWPGEAMNYGPDEQWYELYITYAREMGPLLRQRGYFQQNRPIWSLGDTSVIMQTARMLRELLSKPDFAVEQVDLLCEQLLLQSVLAQDSEPIDQHERRIRAIASSIRNSVGKRLNIHALASNHGMAPATFRRHWDRFMDQPPAKYHQLLTMQEARRLLAETRAPVHAIATRLGFDDPYYFSKRFRQLVGMTPTDYRRQQRDLPSV